MEDDRVFRALADPTRRQLLDQLFERDGRALNELQSQLAMTRFGVMKHLRVLEDAGLVVTRKAGRERLHYLNPVPIQFIYDRWIGKYAARISALADLKTALEGGTTVANETAAGPKQVYELFINAPQQRVWDAITLPEFTKRYFYGSSIESDLKPGSPIRGVNQEGRLDLEGTVLESDPPRRLVYTWRSMWDAVMAAEAPSRITWEIEAMGEAVSRLRVTHDDFDSENVTYKTVAGGWMWLLSNLKTLLETGEPMPPRPGR